MLDGWRACPVPPDSAIAARAVASDDEHDPSLVFSALEEYARTGDPLYRAMSPDFHENIAFQAARALVFEGVKHPNGYTEPLLHRYRAQAKREVAQTEEDQPDPLMAVV